MKQMNLLPGDEGEEVIDLSAPPPVVSSGSISTDGVDNPIVDFDLPPWDDAPIPDDSDAPPTWAERRGDSFMYAQGEGIEFGSGVEEPPHPPVVVKTAKEIREAHVDEDLDIFRRAESFKALKLFSGNSVPGGVTEAYVNQHYGKQGVQRMRLAKFIMKELRFSPSPDVLLMLSSTKRARVVVATAGAGKTTSLQLDLVISKMLDKTTKANRLQPVAIDGTTVTLPRILYLNYNKHNVEMITQRHNSMCDAVNRLISSDDSIDNGIESTTVHAFCHRWLTAFSTEVVLPPLKIISDGDKKKVWEAIITPRWKKYYGDEGIEPVAYTVLDELYNYQTESMLDWDEFFECAKFVDSSLKSDFVKACLKKYDAMKKQMGLLDFTDYLVLMTKVLREHDDLRARLQERYRVIVADENQDFTRLMNELLLQLYNPERNSLTVVGDPDQTIYSFKGVSPDNVVTLCKDLGNYELLGLDTNYRCPDKIVDAAKAILDLNVLRFDKPIQTVKTGGKLQTHPLMDMATQPKEVISLLERLGSEAWPSTIVTYRNNFSALVIAEELYYAGIPFSVIDAQRPFNNFVFRQIIECLRALRSKANMDWNRGLYRFLPMSKDEWNQIVEYNYRQRHINFTTYLFPANLPASFKDAWNLLCAIANVVDTDAVCDYIAPLIHNYRKFYFDFLVFSGQERARGGRGLTREQEENLLYLNRTAKFFKRQMTLDALEQELAVRNCDNPAGVSFSTFHGLKGLEYDYVVAVDFNESIFPDFYGIEQRYPANTAFHEKEAENRLCYVLVTRTMKELHLFYSDVDPSVYVKLLVDAANSGKAGVRENAPEVFLDTVSGFKPHDSQNRFIQRVLGRG